MDIDIKSLSNYQCSLLYDAKNGYSSSIQNYLITNNKNILNLFIFFLEEETSLFIKDFFKKKEIKKIMGNF